MPRRAMIAVRGATMAIAVGDRHARFNELTTGSSSSCWRLQTPFVAEWVTHGSDRADWPSPFRKHTLSLALRHVDRISCDQTACVPPVPPPPAENSRKRIARICWRRARGGLKNGIDPVWHLARQAPEEAGGMDYLHVVCHADASALEWRSITACQWLQRLTLS